MLSIDESKPIKNKNNEASTVLQHILALITDHVWYYFIQFTTCLEFLCLFYQATVYYPYTSKTQINIRIIIWVFNLIYFFDILLISILKWKKYIDKDFHAIWRPWWVIIAEIVAVLPFESFIIPQNRNEEQIYTFIQLIYGIKMVRIIYYFYKSKTEIVSQTYMYRIMLVLFFAFIYQIGIYMIGYVIYCPNYNCSDAWKIGVFEIISGKINGKGCVLSFLMVEMKNTIWNYEIPLIFLTLTYAGLIIYPLTCILVLQMICKLYQKYEYVFKVTFFKSKSSKVYNLEEYSYNRIMDYYNVLWTASGGFTTHQLAESVGKLNQYVLGTEITLENCWPFFQHSQIFNDVELHVLRYVSSFITKVVYIRGQNIFEKDCIKNSMIYILSGAVSIISGENDESGVLTLVGGTCLGESTLIFPYVSRTDFKCKTPCEVYMLERKHMIKVMRKYPKIYQRLRNKILLRYRIGKFYFDQKNTATTHIGDLLWLKNTLHRLMSVTENQKFDHLHNNIYLVNEIGFKNVNDKHHTYLFLNLLVIMERNSTYIDTVFIKSSFLWILRPNSPILHLWEFIIIFLTFATLFLVPYIICHGSTNFRSGILILIHVFFIVDILIQILVPVNSDSKAKTVTKIVAERFQTWGFIFDLITIIPGSFMHAVFPPNSLFLQRQWWELNKILKIWRIYRYFEKWENKFDHNVILHKFCKTFFLYIVFIYFNSCLFIINGEEVHIFSTISIQFSTGIGFCNTALSKSTSMLFTISNNFAFFFEKTAIVGLSSVLLIINMKKENISRRVYDLTMCAKNSKSSKAVLQRLNNFINTQLNENQGVMLVENRITFDALPYHILIILKSHLYLQILLSVEIFSTVPLHILQNLTAYSFLKTYHTYGNIIYRGVIYKELYILVKGKAVILSGLTTTFAEPGCPLNLLEIFYKTPSSRSVVALTDVQIIKFNFQFFLELLKEDKTEWKSFIQAINSKYRSKNHLIDTLKGKRFILVPKEVNVYSFYTFSGYKVKGSFEEYDYCVPFDKLKAFFFIRYFLLGLTINPNGKFLFYWELCKSICVILTCFLFVIPLFGTTPIYSKRAIPLICLDLFGLIDIYLRIHVAYYDKNGIIIKHPLSTLKHYIKGGIWVDLIGIIPLNFIIPSPNLMDKTLLNTIRFIQLFRFVSFTKSCRTGKYRFIFRSTLCIIWYFLGINYIASLLFSEICKKTKSGNIVCKNLKTSEEQSFIYIFYFVTNIFSTTGVIIEKGQFREFHLAKTLRYELKILCLLAISAKIYITSFIFAEKTTLFGSKFQLRAGLSYLHKWLKHKSISSFLQQEITKYYDYYWHSFGKFDPTEIYRYLNKSLRRDLLFSHYRKLINSSIFVAEPDEINDFYKNILLYVKPAVFCKGGYVITINDIESNIFFLYKGRVDVVAADGTCLTELSDGSIFGNLDDEEYFRQRVSIVANTDVHVLSLKSKMFYLIVNYFPEIKKSFVGQKIRNLYYIKSSTDFDNINSISNIKKLRKTLIYFEKLYIIFSYIFVLISLYQIGTMDVNIFFNLIFLPWDIATFIYVILIFHKGRLNKSYSIAKNMRLNKSTFLQIFITLPFDLFFILLLLVLNKDAYYYHQIISILRIIRFSRIYYIAHFEMRETSYISQAPTSLKNIFFVSYNVVFLLLLLSSIIIHIDFNFGNPFDDTLLYHSEDRFYMINFPRRTLLERFSILVKYIFQSLTLFISANSTNYYPNTSLNFFIYIFLLTFWEVIYALLFSYVFDIVADSSYISFRIFDLISYMHFYVKDKHLSPELKQKIFKSLSNYWNYNKKMSDILLIENSPKYLRQTIRLRIYGSLFKGHPVFCNTHFDFLRQLVDCFKVCVYTSNDVIIYKHDDRECMYVIFSGKVAILENEIDVIENALNVISKGCSFGIFQGLNTKSAHKYTYKAINKCEILELEFKHWKYLLDFFPASKEVIFEKSKTYENATHCELLKK